jgi:putative ABC transport system permease protein
VLGKVLTLDGVDYQVIGVTEDDFRVFDTASELWVPYTLDAKELQALGKGSGADGPRSASHTLKVVARLKRGIDIEIARQDLDRVARELAREYPDTNEGWGTNIVWLQEQFVGKIRPTLLTLMGAVFFVLLIACSNVASLLLAQATARQKEFAVRSAMGAGRSRILIQLLTEGMVLSLVSGVLGILLAYAGIRALVAFAPANIPRIDEIAVDRGALLFTALISVMTGLLAGIAPALSASRIGLTEILKSAGRGTTGSRKSRLLRNALIIFEIAFSLVLLIGAGLMIRSFIELQRVNPGFRTAGILTMKFTLPKVRYDGLRVARFHQQLIERVKTIPGVQRAGVTRDIPLSGSDPSLNFIVEHGPVLSSGQQPRAKFRAVSADYLTAMGIPLIQGRFFNDSDSGNSAGVTIINQTMAREFFPNGDAVGQRLQSGFDGSPWSTVVGIIGDVHHGGLESDANAEMYFPYQQIPPAMMNFVEGTMTLVVSSNVDPASLVRPVMEQIRSLDTEEAVFKVATMDDLLRGSTAQPRFRAYLLGVFGAVALILAATGLYGVISFSVGQRSKELGVRAALGARGKDLLRLVMVEGLGLAFAGIAIGLILAYFMAEGLSKLLYAIKPHDAYAFVAVPVVLLSVSGLASLVPAIRAAKADPNSVLRHE